MDTLYKQIDFILSGGALKYLSDFLSSRVSEAMVLETRDSGLYILDAIGTKADDFVWHGETEKLISAFSTHHLTSRFDQELVPLQSNWPWGVRLRGSRWSLYILLKKQPDASFLEDLFSYTGLIHLWQSNLRVTSTEERLARLSYMILATKSTLASIFEPLPLDVYANLIRDVLRESLFPRSVSVFQDEGHSLTFLSGDDRAAPVREGIFAQKILSFTPVITRKNAAPYVIVLPIIAETADRLFCVTEWDKLPTDETLNFMELLGSLASRALSINFLKGETLAEKERVSSGDFTITSLSTVLSALRREKDKKKFTSLVADIFLELTLAPDCFLVIWDRDVKAYAPAVSRRKGINVPYAPEPLPSAEAIKIDETPFFDLRRTDPGRLFAAWGMQGDPWAEMNSMRYVFPFRNGASLEGFIALSEGLSSLSDNSKLAALQIVSQFLGFELQRFI